MTADIGGKAVIECLFSGNPVPTATWYRGSKLLQNDSRIQIETQDDRSTLTITKAHFRDEDEYSCVVANDGGQDTCLIKLTIEDEGDTHSYMSLSFIIPDIPPSYISFLCARKNIIINATTVNVLSFVLLIISIQDLQVISLSLLYSS